MACDLKPYKSELDAASEAVCINRKAKYGKNKVKSSKVVAYQCRVCLKWHITSTVSKSQSNPQIQETLKHGHHSSYRTKPGKQLYVIGVVQSILAKCKGTFGKA